MAISRASMAKQVVVTNSAATGWNVKTYMLNVIKKGKLPK